MDYGKLNEFLSDFNMLRAKGRKVETKQPGDYETGYEVYEISEGVYVKLIVYVDSYGENESVVGVEFVQPKTVTVTNFEPIK
jgi:hypothetical protein